MSVAISSKEHPRIVSLITDARCQTAFAILSLCVIVLFSSARYAFRPYDGMDWHVGDGVVQVSVVYAGGPAEDAGVLTGDQILSIDGRPVDGWGNRPMYEFGVGPGDALTYELRRSHRPLTLSITMGSLLDNVPLLGALAGMIFLSIISWAIGLVLCLFAPPRDVRARLVGLVWLLGGVAMAAGGLGGRSYFWGAYTTLEVTWCWLAAVFVTSHLYFPAPSLVTHRKRIIHAVAIVALLLSALTVLNDWFLNPRGLWLPYYTVFDIHSVIYVFFFLSVLASVGLLLRNRFLSKCPDTRRQTGILIWGTVLGYTPFFALTMLPALFFGVGAEYVRGIYSVLFLALVPLAYAYVIYQRKLLRVDFIINRMVVFFVLVLLILTISILTLGIIALAFDLPTEVPLAAGILAAALSLPSVSLQRGVQERVNRILYGCHYDFSTVTSSFSSRLAQTLDQNRLTDLLVQDLTQQMAIQQAALFLVERDMLTLQQSDVERYSVALDDELCRVLLDGQVPVRAPHLWGLLSPAAHTRWQQFDWAQLFVPLIFEKQFDGLLILGSRSSGDVYSDQDIHIIATIAHQAALAYANVQLVEMLRGLHRRLVRAGEAQRKRVARDLHDTVLQQLFFIKQGLLHDQNHAAFVGPLDDVIQTLRRTIKAQRPPLLDQGLQLALQGLVEDMQVLVDPSVTISWHSNVIRRLALSDEQATALYRIAQESLTNAIKHANARNIIVTLEARSDGATQLGIKDDGVGIPVVERGTRGTEHHYGLVGIQERAAMIDADLHITSAPGEGTTIVAEIKT